MPKSTEEADLAAELDSDEVAWLIERLKRLNASLELAPPDLDVAAITLGQLAELVGCELRGESEVIDHLLDQPLHALEKRYGSAGFRHFVNRHGDADSVADFDALVAAENAEADAALASLRPA